MGTTVVPTTIQNLKNLPQFQFSVTSNSYEEKAKKHFSLSMKRYVLAISIMNIDNDVFRTAGCGCWNE